MGFLQNMRTGRSVALGARMLVGRAGTCTLRIDSRLVSNEHASLWWEDGGWYLRDTGSRNGTWLDGRALKAGERVPVPPGATVIFGHEEHTWTLAEAGPPVALARAPDGTLLAADGGVLCLPSGEDPQVMIFEAADGGWVVEGDAGTTSVHDGHALAVEGTAWILHLPTGNAATSAPSTPPLALHNLALHFRVSQDEEYVEIELSHPGGRTPLVNRAHFELLLLLARARLEDTGHPHAEQGWRYADEVQRMLGVEKPIFNLHVFRARQQLGEVGVAGAAGVVERRASTGQIRLGVDRVEVGALG